MKSDESKNDTENFNMKIEKIRKFNLNLKFRVFLFIEKTITFKFYNRIHFVETKKKRIKFILK